MCKVKLVGVILLALFVILAGLDYLVVLPYVLAMITGILGVVSGVLLLISIGKCCCGHCSCINKECVDVNREVK